MATTTRRLQTRVAATGPSVANIVAFETDLGAMGYVETAKGIARILIGYPSVVELYKQLEAEFPDAETSEHGELADRIDAYCRGERSRFQDVLLDDGDLTAFRREVTLQCQQIPHGDRVSYAQLAERAGNPKAVRAVGSTMARNRWPLVVPCHRVVRSDGSLGGFSTPQGVALKMRLLALEASQSSA